MAEMKLTKNFNLSEFNCNDGSVTPYAVLENLRLLAKELQVLRDFIGRPITINSGYRSPKYNRRIRGAKYSQHLKGTAADIKVDGLSAKEVHGIISELIKDGRMKEGGLGKYSSFTHYDIRGKRARWNG
jgi:uncharacterized protein YcbK (DUF882 family)